MAALPPGPPLVLASASPRRRELLERLGVPFVVRTAPVVEDERAEADPAVLVAHNAALKAMAVAPLEPDRLVLGADTTVALADEVFNKPIDRDDARRMLRRLSGRPHRVLTGLAWRWSGGRDGVDEIETTEVRFEVLSERAIDRYLERVDWRDKAGGYAIQESAERVVSGWAGSYSNVVGLPLLRVARRLEAWGWTPRGVSED